MNDQPPNKKRKVSLPRLKPILYLLCDICREKYIIMVYVKNMFIVLMIVTVYCC